MKEIYIFAPGANGTELVRSMARFGNNNIAYRVVNGIELAKTALMHSGKSLKEEFIPRKDEPSVIDAFIREEKYFKAASFADSEAVASALYSLRSLIAENESSNIKSVLDNGEFPDKNDALLSVYTTFKKALEDNNKIDSIGLMRKALTDANDTLDIITLKEYPLSPLEDALCSKLSANHTELNIIDLFNKRESETQDLNYLRAYGATNEVEAILGYIYENEIPLDNCTIALADVTSYSQIIYDYAQQYGMNVTFGCGISILNSNPAKLLKLYYEWDNKGFHATQSLLNLIMSDAFDRQKLLDELQNTEITSAKELTPLCELAGTLHISPDKTKNDSIIKDYEDATDSTLTACRILAKELERSCTEFLSKYAIIRREHLGRIDRSAIKVIIESVRSYTQFSSNSDFSAIVSEILNKSVCSENSREGSLHVTNISGALVSMREHLFIAGLSANVYPGSPKENYLLLDNDYLKAGQTLSNILPSALPTSENIIRNKIQSYQNLINLATSLGVHVQLSYSNFNLADLKGQNPSSVLFETYNAGHGGSVKTDEFMSAFKNVGFFEKNISSADCIGREYINGKATLPTASAPISGSITAPKDKVFSPSAIDVFFTCPRRYYLQRVLGIEEPEEYKPFEIISAIDFGNLAHACMEQLANSKMPENEFLDMCREKFDHYLREHPPINENAVDHEKNIFLDTMKNAFRQDPHTEVVFIEKEVETETGSGLKIGGRVDRIEKLPDGKHVIVDYKTGQNVNHSKDDINTCLQAVMYAYMFETSEGIAIDHCEYRYLRNRHTVTCEYNDEMKTALLEKLKIFEDALTIGEFPLIDKKTQDSNDSPCKYCKYASICGKEM